MRKILSRMGTAVRGFGFKQWFFLILNVVLVLGAVACALGLRRVSGTLDTLTAAGRFQGAGRSATPNWPATCRWMAASRRRTSAPSARAWRTR